MSSDSERIWKFDSSAYAQVFMHLSVYTSVMSIWIRTRENGYVPGSFAAIFGVSDFLVVGTQSTMFHHPPRLSSRSLVKRIFQRGPPTPSSG